MKDEILAKLSQLENSVSDIAISKNSITNKWSKHIESDCLLEQELTPYKVAFLYILLDRYEYLLKNEISEFLNQNMKIEIPMWEPLNKFKAEDDVGVNCIDLDGLESGKWEIAFNNKYDYAIFHVQLNGWKPYSIGFTF